MACKPNLDRPDHAAASFSYQCEDSDSIYAPNPHTVNHNSSQVYRPPIMSSRHFFSSLQPTRHHKNSTYSSFTPSSFPQALSRLPQIISGWDKLKCVCSRTHFRLLLDLRRLNRRRLFRPESLQHLQSKQHTATSPKHPAESSEHGIGSCG